MAEAGVVSALVEKPIDVPALLKLIQELMAGPVQSRLPRAIHQVFPFHPSRAAVYASRFKWNEQNISPWTSGGLHE